MIRFFSVGKISKPHGVKGEVNIIPFDEELGLFSSLQKIFISSSDVEENDLKEVEIDSVKFKNKRVVIKFRDFNSCNDAEELRNKFVRVRREELTLEDGDYFIADIINCSVYDEDGMFLGIVSDVIKTKNNDVYWIRKTDQNDELLIPVLKSVVLDINTCEQKIVIRSVKSWLL